MRRVGKPTQVQASVLAKCFPSLQSTQPKVGFNPNMECVATEARRKKKAAIKGKQRSVTVNVVMLKQYLPFIPKGQARKKLSSAGRIRNISVSRDMTSLEIRNKIVRVFEVASFSCLEVDGSGRLVKVSSESLNGESAVSRRGSLYVYETQVSPIICSFSRVILNFAYVLYIFSVIVFAYNHIM